MFLKCMKFCFPILIPGRAKDGFLTGKGSDKERPSDGISVFLGNDTPLNLVIYRVAFCTNFPTFLSNKSVLAFTSLRKASVPVKIFIPSFKELLPHRSPSWHRYLPNTPKKYRACMAPLCILTSRVIEEFYYLYFNRMNLALKSTMAREALSVDTMRILNGIHEEFTR